MEIVEGQSPSHRKSRKRNCRSGDSRCCGNSREAEESPPSEAILHLPKLLPYWLMNCRPVVGSQVTEDCRRSHVKVPAAVAIMMWSQRWVTIMSSTPFLLSIGPQYATLRIRLHYESWSRNFGIGCLAPERPRIETGTKRNQLGWPGALPQQNSRRIATLWRFLHHIHDLLFARIIIAVEFHPKIIGAP